MTCYLYPGGLLHGENIRIAKIIFLKTSYNPTTIGVPTIGYPTTYSAHHNRNWPKFYVNDELCYECKKFEILGNGFHQDYF